MLFRTKLAGKYHYNGVSMVQLYVHASQKNTVECTHSIFSQIAGIHHYGSFE